LKHLKHAYFLVMPNTHVLDLAGPLQVVATLKELGLADVGVECIGPLDAVRTFQTAMLSDIRPLPARLRPGAAVFAVGSKLDATLTGSRPWLDAAAWLRDRAAQAEAGLQVCGICTGTFLLAQAGLLDGRWCTTHHRFTRELQRRFPAVHVADNRVYVRDGNLWTSAGVTAGIDLALHLVADTFGDDAALQVARENVVHFRRFGGDPELGALMRHRSHCNARIHAVQDAIARDLTRNDTCEQLAHSVGCSGRHLARVFTAETGITIKGFQTELRMDLARRLLTESKLSLERIAERCGFASVQAFRANWDQREDLPPSAWRPRQAKAT
jgi:transcriptional regulator GlxA family with amidase domain